MDNQTTEPAAFAGEEAEITEESWEAPYYEAKPRPALGRGSARMATLLGFGLTAGGVVAAAGPKFVPQVAQVAGQLSSMGIHAGSLIVGGIGLFAIGAVGRALAAVAERPRESDPNVASATDRMADQVAALAGAVSSIQEQVQYLALREPVVHVDAPAPDDDLVQLYRDQKDSIFRLAASLDKLGKQISDRIQGDLAGVEGQFDSVRGQVRSMHEALSGELERHFADSLTRRAPSPAAPTQAALSQQPTPAPQPLQPQAVQPIPEPPAALPSRNGPLEVEAPSSTSAPAPSAAADLRRAPVVSQPPMSVESPPAALPGAPPASMDPVELEEPHPQLTTEVSPLAFLEGLKNVEPASQNPHSPDVVAPPLDFDTLAAPQGTSPPPPPAP